MKFMQIKALVLEKSFILLPGPVENLNANKKTTV